MALVNITRRGMVGGLAAGVAGLASSDKLVSSARAQTARKTFVLVGGAYFGAWVWRRVTDRLDQQGHKSYPLTLTGLGDRSHLMSKDINLDTHIADIANLIEWEDLKDICLVAHSYAGYPASGALERIGDRVSSIVWVDALKPDDGQKFIDGFPNLKVPEGTISIPSPKTSALPDPKDAAWMVSKMTPHPFGVFLQPVKLTGAREKVAKKTYIRLPKFPSANLDKAYAECKEDKSWTTVENTTTLHAAMVDNPDWLTSVLVQAA